MIDELKDDLRRHEGYRRQYYRDSLGILTIGIGHNLENGLHPDVIEHQFIIDVNEALDTCEMIFPNFYTLSENRQRCLANMAFNLGYKLNQFKLMIAAIYREDWEEAAKQMLDSLWAKQVGNRANELAELMREGQ